MMKGLLEILALLAGAGAGIFILNMVSDRKVRKEEHVCKCKHDADGDCCGGCGHCHCNHEEKEDEE